MGHTIELTDDQYEAFAQAAAAKGQTPAELLAAWIEELRQGNREPHHYETEEWFRHLGATEEQIAEAKRIASERSQRTQPGARPGTRRCRPTMSGRGSCANGPS